MASEVSALWAAPMNLVWILVRTVVVYLVLILGIRLSGKREMAQLTPVDLVLLLVLSNAVQNAMVGPDDSLTGGIMAAATLLVVNAFITRIGFKKEPFRKLVDGRPAMLIHQGELLQETLDQEKLTVDELMSALRGQGIGKIENCELAMFEVDGSISALRKGEEVDAEYYSRARHRFIRHTRRSN